MYTTIYYFKCKNKDKEKELEHERELFNNIILEDTITIYVNTNKVELVVLVDLVIAVLMHVFIQEIQLNIINHTLIGIANAYLIIYPITE